MIILASLAIYIIYKLIWPKFSFREKRNANLFLDGLKSGLREQDVNEVDVILDDGYKLGGADFKHVFLFCLHSVKDYKFVDSWLAESHFAKESGFWLNKKFKFSPSDIASDYNFEKAEFDLFLSVSGNHSWFEKGKMLGRYYSPFFFIKTGKQLQPLWKKFLNKLFQRNND